MRFASRRICSGFPGEDSKGQHIECSSCEFALGIASGMGKKSCLSHEGDYGYHIQGETYRGDMKFPLLKTQSSAFLFGRLT